MASQYDSVWVPTLWGNFLTSYEGVLDSTWSYDLCRKIDADGEFIKPVDIDSVGSVGTFADNTTFAQKPIVYTLSQQNIPYKLSMEIDVEDVRRDHLGLFESRVSEMAGKFADHINKLVISLTTGNPNCFDGTPFFGSTHPVNGTTQANTYTSSNMPVLASSNYTGSTSTAPTPVQMAAVILQAHTAFYGLVDNAGDPINGGAKEFQFVTGNPAVYGAMIAAIDSLQLTQGQTNVLITMQDGGKAARYALNPKAAKYLATYDPRLPNNSTFWGYRIDSEVKPFIWAEEEALTLKYLGEGSDLEARQNKYLWSAKTVRSVGVGRYQHAAQYTLS